MRDEAECFCIGDDVCRYCAALAQVNDLSLRLHQVELVSKAKGEAMLAADAECQRLSSRLGEALKFVEYIAKRYEESWDEPVTERFYNEAKALLAGAVEISSTTAHAQAGATKGESYKTPQSVEDARREAGQRTHPPSAVETSLLKSGETKCSE